MSFDIYAAITDRITAELEKGVIPWQKPWTGGSSAAISRSTGKPYSLLNQMLLGKPGEYLTFKQCQAEGGKVRKGEKSRMVVFWKWLDKKDENGAIIIDDNGKPQQTPFLTYYNVFHIDQCEGIAPKYSKETKHDTQPDAAADSIIAGYLQRSGVKLIQQHGDRAFYRPSTDTVTVPQIDQYAEVAEYYSTVFHELTHSTGHSSRLNRLDRPASFGSEEYSKEELVAEIGAASLVNVAGLETKKSFRNSAAYIQSWLKALRNDKRLIVSAASRAEKAVSLILN